MGITDKINNFRKEHPWIFIGIIIAFIAIIVAVIIVIVVTTRKRKRQEEYNKNNIESFGVLDVKGPDDYVRTAIDSIMGNGDGVHLDV